MGIFAGFSVGLVKKDEAGQRSFHLVAEGLPGGLEHLGEQGGQEPGCWVSKGEHTWMHI